MCTSQLTSQPILDRILIIRSNLAVDSTSGHQMCITDTTLLISIVFTIPTQSNLQSTVMTKWPHILLLHIAPPPLLTIQPPFPLPRVFPPRLHSIPSDPVYRCIPLSRPGYKTLEPRCTYFKNDSPGKSFLDFLLP